MADGGWRTTAPRPGLVLGAIVLVTTLAAFIGGLAGAGAREFYAQLAKPPWAPPGWLFGPAWTVLYTMMAISAWLVYREKGSESRPLMLLYVAQLAVNALWSWVFFSWKLGAVAFAEAILLWLLVLLTLLSFWRAKRIAGMLLIPYLLWVTFATALTFAVWRANPTLL